MSVPPFFICLIGWEPRIDLKPRRYIHFFHLINLYAGWFPPWAFKVVFYQGETSPKLYSIKREQLELLLRKLPHASLGATTYLKMYSEEVKGGINYDYAPRRLLRTIENIPINFFFYNLIQCFRIFIACLVIISIDMFPY